MTPPLSAQSKHFRKEGILSSFLSPLPSLKLYSRFVPSFSLLPSYSSFYSLTVCRSKTSKVKLNIFKGRELKEKEEKERERERE